MKTWRKWAIGTAGVSLFGLGLLIVLFDWNWLRAPVIAAGVSQSGRSVAIDRIDGEWAWRPRFRLSGVRLGNIDRATDREMFVAERVEFVIDLPALMRGRLELPEIKLVKPRLSFERLADGTSNWSFGARAAAEAALPDDRGEMPLIGRLEIDGGDLKYRDPIAGIDLQGTIGTARGDGKVGAGNVMFQGRGSWQGESFTLRLVGGSLLSLREGEAPYPLTIDIMAGDIAAGPSRAHIAGTLADPIRLEGLALDMRLQGPNLAALTKLTGVPLPNTPNYDLAAKLDRRGAVWALNDLAGRMGHSDLAGRLTIDTGRERLFVDADLNSKILDYRDVGALIGIPQPGQIPAASSAKSAPAARPAAPADPIRVLPDAKLMVAEIRKVDARVKFKGAKVEAPNTPLEAVELQLELQDGVLKLTPVALGIAGGRAIANISIDARQAEVKTDFDVRLAAFRLERFLAAAGFPDAGKGRIDGRVRLVGTGDSVRKALASANGEIRLVMDGGDISNLAVELVGLDVAQSLGFFVGGDENTPIRCLVGDIGVTNGVMTPRLFLLDTEDSAVTVSGETDLSREALALRIEAHPKDTSLFSLRAPIRIGGHLSAPTIGIDGAPVGARVAGAVALGVFLTPLAAILAFIDPSLTADSDCARLLQENRPK